MEDKIKSTLHNVQQGSSSHQKYLKILKNLYHEVPFDDFIKALFKHLKRIFHMDIAVTNPYVERTLDFLAQFVSALTKPNENDAQISLDEDSPSHPFLTHIIYETLRFHDLDYVQARYYSCRFITLILHHIGHETHLDNDICDTIQQCMLERILDPKASIRLQAVMALVRLQEPSNLDCPVIRAYLTLLTDANHWIRKEVVTRIAPTAATILKLSERTRDADYHVRIAAYTRCADIGPKFFEIIIRQQILKCGFHDENTHSNSVFIKYLVPKWLTAYDGNFLALLNALKLDADESDIINTEEITKKVMEVFFRSVPIKEIIDAIPIDNDRLIPLKNLSSEVIAYWNIVISFLRSSDEMEEYLDTILPELTPFCNYIESIIDHKTSKEMEDWEYLDYQYILYNLFDMAEQYDLADEVGRSTFHKLVMSVLQNHKLRFKLAQKVVGIADKLISNINILSNEICHIISDIREPLVEKPASQDENTNNNFQIAEFTVKINILQGEIEDALSTQEFEKATVLQTQLLELKKQLEELNKQNQVIKVKVSKDDAETICRCLDLLSALLSLPSVNSLSPALETCKNEFLLTLFASNVVEVKWRVLRCLALFCIIDRNLAEEHLKVFCIPIATYRKIADYHKFTIRESVGAICDLIRVHGSELFGSEEDTSSQHNATKRRLYRNEDMFDLIAVENDRMNMEFIIETILDMLDDEYEDIRETAITGITKLILNGFPVTSSLISRIILKWFNPLTEKTSDRIQQKLGTLISNYTKSVKGAREIIREAVIPTLSSIASAPRASPLVDVDIENVVQFLAVVTNSNETTDIVHIHTNLAHTLYYKIAIKPKDPVVPYLTKMLLYLELPTENSASIKELIVEFELLLQEEEDGLDKGPRKTVTKFVEKLKASLRNVKVDETLGNTESTIQQADNTNIRPSVNSTAETTENDLAQTNMRIASEESENHISDASSNSIDKSPEKLEEKETEPLKEQETQKLQPATNTNGIYCGDESNSNNEERRSKRQRIHSHRFDPTEYLTGKEYAKTNVRNIAAGGNTSTDSTVEENTPPRQGRLSNPPNESIVISSTDDDSGGGGKSPNENVNNGKEETADQSKEEQNKQTLMRTRRNATVNVSTVSKPPDLSLEKNKDVVSTIDDNITISDSSGEKSPNKNESNRKDETAGKSKDGETDKQTLKRPRRNATPVSVAKKGNATVSKPPSTSLEQDKDVVSATDDNNTISDSSGEKSPNKNVSNKKDGTAEKSKDGESDKQTLKRPRRNATPVSVAKKGNATVSKPPGTSLEQDNDVVSATDDNLTISDSSGEKSPNKNVSNKKDGTAEKSKDGESNKQTLKRPRRNATPVSVAKKGNATVSKPPGKSLEQDNDVVSATDDNITISDSSGDKSPNKNESNRKDETAEKSKDGKSNKQTLKRPRRNATPVSVAKKGKATISKPPGKNKDVVSATDDIITISDSSGGKSPNKNVNDRKGEMAEKSKQGENNKETLQIPRRNANTPVRIAKKGNIPGSKLPDPSPGKNKTLYDNITNSRNSDSSGGKTPNKNVCRKEKTTEKSMEEENKQTLKRPRRNVNTPVSVAKKGNMPGSKLPNPSPGKNKTLYDNITSSTNSDSSRGKSPNKNVHNNAKTPEKSMDWENKQTLKRPRRNVYTPVSVAKKGNTPGSKPSGPSPGKNKTVNDDITNSDSSSSNVNITKDKIKEKPKEEQNKEALKRPRRVVGTPVSISKKGNTAVSKPADPSLGKNKDMISATDNNATNSDSGGGTTPTNNLNNRNYKTAEKSKVEQNNKQTLKRPRNDVNVPGSVTKKGDAKNNKQVQHTNHVMGRRSQVSEGDTTTDSQIDGRGTRMPMRAKRRKKVQRKLDCSGESKESGKENNSSVDSSEFNSRLDGQSRLTRRSMPHSNSSLGPAIAESTKNNVQMTPKISTINSPAEYVSEGSGTKRKKSRGRRSQDWDSTGQTTLRTIAEVSQRISLLDDSSDQPSTSTNTTQRSLRSSQSSSLCSTPSSSTPQRRKLIISETSSNSLSGSPIRKSRRKIKKKNVHD